MYARIYEGLSTLDAKLVGGRLNLASEHHEALKMSDLEKIDLIKSFYQAGKTVKELCDILQMTQVSVLNELRYNFIEIVPLMGR